MSTTLDSPPLMNLAHLSPDIVVERLRERQQEAARRMNRLTERERQVVVLVAQGYSNKAVAIRLHLSIKTVEKHRGSAMRKLQLRSICDLSRLWFQLTWDDQLFSS